MQDKQPKQEDKDLPDEMQKALKDQIEILEGKKDIFEHEIKQQEEYLEKGINIDFLRNKTQVMEELKTKELERNKTEVKLKIAKHDLQRKKSNPANMNFVMNDGAAR